jgi:glycosyltransferase involved in cell wall biosynthesis
MLSVLIPHRNCQFLNKTIKDVLTKAEGEIEVIINVDEKRPERVVDDPRVKYLFPTSPQGLRKGVNACADIAKGKYIMKTDDHCMFGQGFDRILIENHQADNWIQIPRRYSLDAENWKINTSRPYRDYMYIDFPRKGKDHDDGMHGVEWYERQRERTGPEYDIDDTPSMQGSCYFMTRDYYVNFIGGMQEYPIPGEVGYGQFSQESQELGFKTWLGGGAMKINKKTWYAHLHKGKTYGRMYSIPGWNDYTVKASNWSAEYWLNNRWEDRVYDFEWFIDEMFPGMPTWPTDWKNQIKEMGWIK